MVNNVVIVAGGKGLRMGYELPKQFLPIEGRPVLMRTIQAFYQFDPLMKIVVVLSEDYFQYWNSLCKEYGFTIPHTVTTGGETRFHSVKNGLKFINEGLVAIQDAARPFPSQELIARIFDSAKINKAVIPAIDSTDSLREVTNGNKSRIIDRSKIKLVQTPQVFDAKILKEAYECEFQLSFTDDASVVESFGVSVVMVKGETTNIKITTPLDLEIGKAILNTKG